MSGRRAGKLARVTGCGSIGPGWGSGEAVSVAVARAGVAVVGVERGPAAGKETAGLIHAGAASAPQTAATTVRCMPSPSIRAPAASATRFGPGRSCPTAR